MLTCHLRIFKRKHHLAARGLILLRMLLQLQKLLRRWQLLDRHGPVGEVSQVALVEVRVQREVLNGVPLRVHRCLLSHGLLRGDHAIIDEVENDVAVEHVLG